MYVDYYLNFVAALGSFGAVRWVVAIIYDVTIIKFSSNYRKKGHE